MEKSMHIILNQSVSIYSRVNTKIQKHTAISAENKQVKNEEKMLHGYFSQPSHLYVCA